MNGTAGNYRNAGLPNITGSISKKSSAGTTTDFLSDSTGLDENGALSVIYGDQNATANDNAIKERPNGIIFDASKSNIIYGNSTTVQPNSLTTRFYIKY